MPVRSALEEKPNQTLIIDPGSVQISTITGIQPSQATAMTWRLINNTDGTVVIAESTDSIVAIDDGEDAALRRYQRPYTAPSAAGEYLAIWRYELTEEAQAVVVATSATAMFATADDVALRLKRSLATSESAQIEYLLEMAAAVIADAAGYDDGWAVQLTSPPTMLRMLSVELACRALANPSQVDQLRQQVGSYSVQASWSTVGMTLSDAEVLAVRRTVHGRTTEDVHIPSSLIRAQDEYWLRKQIAGINDPGGTIK